MNYLISFELYNNVVELHPNIKQNGKTMPNTSISGCIFSIIDNEGNFRLHLFQPDIDNFIQNFSSKLMIQYGVVINEYVFIPQNLLEDTSEILKYLLKSFKHVSALKPKPTKHNK